MDWVGLATLLEHNRVVVNSLTNSNGFYENADLTQNFTMRKAWEFKFLSGAWGGVYTITD